MPPPLGPPQRGGPKGAHGRPRSGRMPGRPRSGRMPGRAAEDWGDKHTINSVIMTNSVHTFHDKKRPPVALRRAGQRRGLRSAEPTASTTASSTTPSSTPRVLQQDGPPCRAPTFGGGAMHKARASVAPPPKGARLRAGHVLGNAPLRGAEHTAPWFCPAGRPTAARGVRSRSAAPAQRPTPPLLALDVQAQRPPLERPPYRRKGGALKGGAVSGGGGVVPTTVGTSPPSNGSTGGALSPRTLVLLRLRPAARPSPAEQGRGLPTPSVLQGGELRGVRGLLRESSAERASLVRSGQGPRPGRARALADQFTNCLMKSGNLHVAEKVLSKASMFIKMNSNANIKANQKKSNRRNQFGHLVREAILQVKPLVELNTQSGASARSRRKKPKAIPMSSRRGEKLAIQ